MRWCPKIGKYQDACMSALIHNFLHNCHITFRFSCTQHLSNEESMFVASGTFGGKETRVEVAGWGATTRRGGRLVMGMMLVMMMMLDDDVDDDA